jgi:hypothetical protein
MALDVPGEEQAPKVIPETERIVPVRLRNPKDTRPEPKPIVSDAANVASFWLNTKWWFYQQIPVNGDSEIDAAEFVINANLSAILFMRSSEVQNGCTTAVRNDLNGRLIVHPATASVPYPWLQFIVTGTQYWTDDCEPQLDHSLSISGQWNWLAKQLDRSGLTFEFFNGNYARGNWYANFIVHRMS